MAIMGTVPVVRCAVLFLVAMPPVCGFTLSSSAARHFGSASSRSAEIVAGLFSEDWMARLGTETNSKKKWVRPKPNDSLAPGSVIMSEPGNFDHYFLESLVLIIEHDEAVGTRGVLLNHETPWQVEELSPGDAMRPFRANGHCPLQFRPAGRLYFTQRPG